MFKADIHIKTHDMGERVGIELDIEAQNVGFTDKMMLMHSLARSLNMSTLEIAIYALAEKDKAFDRSDPIEFRIPKPFKEAFDES